ncbi:MAG: DNA polymerase I [Bacteroidetes bacterium]|nr:DNA polymerase I [Bacteroidota bacterium]MBU1115075.1 DNA polymerase I [Bacteroidota bacterium]MBU1797177.1 DNA polymerase I [Bacteroidota bacterium]
MENLQKRFVIIDAMAIAYRSYFAFIKNPLKNSKGEPTSAVYGFVNQLFKIIQDSRPDYLAIAYDSKEKTFRHERYDKYKSSRTEMPEDLIPQIKRIKEIIEALNIPLYILPRYEADDLVGTAVKRAESEGLISFAVSPDKDYVQLVTDKVTVIKPGRSGDDIVKMDKAKVIEEYGFEPKFMIDYLALVGDSSDDIPGVAGIGPKNATPLIQQFGHIEDIYNNIEKIEKKGVRAKLEANKENAFLSKELATIETNVPFEFNFEDAKFTPPNFEKVIDILNELELKSLINKVNKIYNSSESEVSSVVEEKNMDSKYEADKVEYKLITDLREAEKLASLLNNSELFVFDTETNSLDTLNVKIAGVSFAVKTHEAFFIPINPFVISNTLFDRDLSDRINIDDFTKIFKPIFENKEIKKVCQNGKYDIAVLRTNGINVENFYFDTMLASYIIDPDQKHGMDALSKKYLEYSPISFSEIMGKVKDPNLIFDVELDKLSIYACEDADITFRLYKLFKKLLIENNLTEISEKVDFPLVKVLEDMERTGINLNTKALNDFSVLLKKSMEEYTKAIYEIAGETFNLNSPKQLQVILFDKMNLPSNKKTKTGFSTDASSLEALKGTNPIIDYLLEFRQATKLKSTYADSLPKLIDPVTKRVHTSFSQTVASTGRLSSLNPNLQNIPIRTDLGKKIREAFIPRDKNHVLLSSDYSQIELRIMASICEDETLMKAFGNGEDIHTSTAALVFQIPKEEVTPDMRRKAKEVNFGILYGIGAFGLSTRLGITRAHGKEIIDTYFENFSNVKNFIDNSIAQAKEKEYAETLLGRRRYLKNINSKNRVLRQFEERVAVNMPIQGTAADMIKLAMIKVQNELKRISAKTQMVLQVHDELVFDVPKDELEIVKPIIKKSMEEAFLLKVPVVVEIGVGNNWLEAH